MATMATANPRQLDHLNGSWKKIVPMATVTIEHITTEVVPTVMRFPPIRSAGSQSSVLAMNDRIRASKSPEEGWATHLFEKYPPSPNIEAESDSHRYIILRPLPSGESRISRGHP